jgi:hypothetical protein
MTESSFVAGRVSEQVELAHALKSGRPELIAVYGRRRVGKTYLIRGFFVEKICLEVTGARGASLKDQLANFVRVLETRVPYPLAVPASWADAFDMLKRYFVWKPNYDQDWKGRWESNPRGRRSSDFKTRGLARRRMPSVMGA